MKCSLPIYILILSGQTAFAQNDHIQLSLGSGISNSSSKGKENFMGNGYNLHADGFLPFYKNVKSTNSFAIGLTVGGNFTRSRNLLPNNSDAATRYKVYNTPVAFDTRSDKGYSNGYSVQAGIQSQFGFRKFYFSPAFNSGYLSMELEGFTQTGSISVNGENQQKEVVRRDKQKTSGWLIRPQLKIGYWLTNTISVYAGAAYTSGPKAKITTWQLMPKGGFKDDNTYEISQLANGSYSASTQVSRICFTEFNFGLSFAIGRKNRTKPAGAASASYAAGRSIPSGKSSGKSINEKGVKRNEAAAARPGNPIGGIVVKGGKNPGGNMMNLVSDENGKIEFEVKEAGNYKFQLTMPEAPASKSISSKGVKRNETAVTRPGTPIGGIVVKGGKNPGGNSVNVISDSNGEIMLNELESGSYFLIIQSPENAPRKTKKTVEKATSGLKDTLKTQV